ncbi:manganese efflux pump [Allopusillimonas ginsengisoli]|uniref:manganese efflux pump n=1 Tax=Allopusillimonas ginsengisoli TaxID=453575 RepID=UPI0039C4D90C
MQRKKESFSKTISRFPFAFTLLLILGALMMRNGMRAEWSEAVPAICHPSWLLAATRFATGIDAMVVGVCLAYIDDNIPITAAAIRLVTFLMVTPGFMVGRLMAMWLGG